MGLKRLENNSTENYLVATYDSIRQLFGDFFDLSNIKEMYFDGKQCEPVRRIYSNEEHTVKIVLNENVTDLSDMFARCDSLKSLDLSHFNTSNVENMANMFWDCKSLKSLDLSNFDTSNVKSMRNMFQGCHSLKSLDLSNFDTRNVEDMSCMFWDCKKLSNLKMGGEVSKIDYVDHLFYDIGTNSKGEKTFYYPSKYDYSKLINQLPEGWKTASYELKAKHTKAKKTEVKKSGPKM